MLRADFENFTREVKNKEKICEKVQKLEQYALQTLIDFYYFVFNNLRTFFNC